MIFAKQKDGRVEKKSASSSGTGGMRKAPKRGRNLLGFQTGFTGLTVFFA